MRYGKKKNYKNFKNNIHNEDFRSYERKHVRFKGSVQK